MTLITARDRNGCYGCGRPFARREWPVLDKLDRRWHMLCFIRDDSARIDPAAVKPAGRNGLILPGTILAGARRRLRLS